MYIVYIIYSVLWVFALSVGGFDYFMSVRIICGWFEIVIDACMKIYIVYILYPVLWILTLFVGYFDCFIQILISFKIRAGQPIKKWFYASFKCFELEIVLKFTELHDL